MSTKKAKNTPTKTTDLSVGQDVSNSTMMVGDNNQINYYGELRPATILRAVPPAPPLHFTGREDERARLRAALLAGETVAITALHGMGGVGKTALAQKVAQELLEGKAFPGGVLWWSLGPNADAFAALSAWAAYFDPQADLTQLSPDARAGFVRAGLAQLGRLCAVLDDAWDEESAQGLLVALPPGTAILLTTRDADLAKALRCRVERDLPGLPEDQCLALLAGLLGPLEGYEPAAKDIAALTEGLPLALELVAGLADAPADLPALARQLHEAAHAQRELPKLPGPASDEKREKNLEACFALSYNALTPELQMRFRALGVFPVPFAADALFAVWNAADTDALQRLLRRSLLKKDERGSLRQHNLLNAYAAALLRRDAAEESDARQRHADYYLEQGSQADDLYQQGGEHVLEGLGRFDALWPHLQAAYDNMAQAAGDPRAARWLNAFPNKLAYLLELRLPARRRIPLLESALAAARRLEDQYEGIHLRNLGNAYADLGETRRAIEFYEQRLAIAREIGDRRGEGNALGNLGNAYADLGETRHAIEFYQQRLEIAREIGERHSEGVALGDLGNAYIALGETRRAIGYYEQALVIDREIGDRRGEGADLCNLGVAYKNLGEIGRAIEYHEQDLAIAHEIGDRRGEGQALGNLGVAYKNLGETRRAIEYYEQSLIIKREIGDRQGEAKGSWNLGLLFEGQGELRRAAALMQVRVDFLRAIGHPGVQDAAKYVEDVRRRVQEQPPPPSQKNTGTA